VFPVTNKSIFHLKKKVASPATAKDDRGSSTPVAFSHAKIPDYPTKFQVTLQSPLRPKAPAAPAPVMDPAKPSKPKRQRKKNAKKVAVPASPSTPPASSVPELPPKPLVRHDQRCISCGKNGFRASNECKHSVCDDPKCSAKHGEECYALPELFDMIHLLSTTESTPSPFPIFAGRPPHQNKDTSGLTAQSLPDTQGAHPPEPTPLQDTTISKKQVSEPSTQKRPLEAASHSASRDSFETKVDSFDELRPCPLCDGVFFRSTQELVAHFTENDVKAKHKSISDARNRAAVKVHAAAIGRQFRQNKCELCDKPFRSDREFGAHQKSKGHAAAVWAGKVAIQAFAGYQLKAANHNGRPDPELPEVLNDIVLEPLGLPKELADSCASLRLGLSATSNSNRWSAFLRAVRTGTLGAAGLNVADDLAGMERTETDILDEYLGTEDLDDDDYLGMEDFDGDDADLFGEMSE
jgi:hypothetical protein